MENVLEIVELTLINLARKYQTFTEQEDLKYVDIKDYDTELNDIMERYKTLKSLQSVISVDDLQILYNEYNTIFQDFKAKYESGYFIGKDGLNGTFEDLTQEEKDSLKGQNGLSAYEIGLNEGFEGTESEWLESLKGSNGTFEALTQEQKDSLKGQNGLSAYEIAQNEGYEGTEAEWLESLKGPGIVEGGSNLSLPIEIQDVNELGANLTQIFQTLGQLSGGTISGININQLNGELQGLKSQVLGQYNALNGQLTSILTRLETLENSSSTPAIMEKTLTFKQSEEGYNILTNFIPNEGETGFLVMNLSADGSETGAFRLGFTFDSSLPFYQCFNIVYDGAFEADTFTFNIEVLRSKDNNLILFIQLLSVGGEPTISDITLSLKIETEQNHSSLNFINVSDSGAFVQENWI